MTVRADIAELLNAGHSDAAIYRQLHVDRKTAAKARAELGLPKAKSGYKAAATAEDLFWRRTKPTGDGHIEWAGYRTSDGTPALRHRGRVHTAYRLAFRIANGRDPEGYVLPSCGHEGCVKPGHHSDRAGREQEQRVDSLYAAIFGEAS